MEGVHDQVPALGSEVAEHHLAGAEHVELVRRLALGEQAGPGLEVHVVSAAGQEGELFARQSGEEGVFSDQVCDRVHCASAIRDEDRPSVARIAATSSVMSIPTGHQVMHRPQPTHPDVPNWSCQVDSL